MKKAPATTARKENPIPKPPSSDSSQAHRPVPAQATFPMHDIQTEWRLASESEPTTTADPKEATILRELEEEFGSKVEARRIFALFSAMHQGKSAGAATTAPQPPTIHVYTTTQTSIPHSEKAQAPIEESTQDQPHAETGPSPIIEEQGGVGGLEVEQEGVSGFAEELDEMTVDDFGNEAAKEGKISGEKFVEGETPVSKSV